jgi:signal transduction histidine kinase
LDKQDSPHNKSRPSSADPMSAALPDGIDQEILARLDWDHESERMRSARHLHDRVAIPLSDAKLKVGALLAAQMDPASANHCEEIFHAFDDILREVRSEIGELRPPLLDDLGLSETLGWYRRSQSNLGGCSLELSLNPADADIPEPLSSVIYRLIQMLVSGLALETQADTLRIEVNKRSDEILIEYRDDGLAIDALGPEARDMLPMAKIRFKVYSQGGRFNVNRASTKGNAIQISIPAREKKDSSASGGRT